MNSEDITIAITQRTDLLDELFRLVHCGFLSDLPQQENWPELCRALQRIDPPDFTLKSWEEAVLYLCGGRQNFQTAEQARDYLLEQIG